LLFARSTQGVLEGGLRIELASGLHAAAQLAYEGGRRASESGLLARHAIADIDRGASIGVQLEWDSQIGPVPLSLLARVRQHVDADHGAQFDLRLSSGVFKSGAVAAGVYVQGVWADAKSTRALYGVTLQQSSASSLPVFAAGRGWLAASVGLLGSLDLGPQWVLVGSLEARRLRGDAADSPLVERASNHYLNAGLAYRF
jgi:outer membrane scaffolding protein for murein synthesis (MipA/OmpV family)